MVALKRLCIKQSDADIKNNIETEYPMSEELWKNGMGISMYDILKRSGNCSRQKTGKHDQMKA